MLAFTSVYFLESNLFNGLRAFGVKKFSPFKAAPKSYEAGPPPSSVASGTNASQAPPAIGGKKDCSTKFRLREDFAIMKRGCPSHHEPESLESELWTRSPLCAQREGQLALSRRNPPQDSVPDQSGLSKGLLVALTKNSVSQVGGKDVNRDAICAANVNNPKK
jgi:hypothetical protein